MASGLNRALFVGASLGLALAGGGAVWAASGQAVNPPPSANTPMATAQAPGSPVSFAGIFEKVSPAVVSIEIEGKAGASHIAMRGGDADPSPLPTPRGGGKSPDRSPDRGDDRIRALGSGFFISADGYIVTNNHVVEDAETITVKTSDKTELKARLIGRDPATDLAVVKVEGTSFPFVNFEETAMPRVGDWVVAVGNPFGFGGTATAGIVSALGRDGIGENGLVDYLQIDAPINSGNSGGPTFDVYGRVVGVNTMIYSPGGGSVGIGFDIPANVVARTAKQLIATGKVNHGFIGASIAPVTADIADSLGLKTTNGALIAAVTPEGPAEKSGLLPGDVVLQVNGDTITSNSDLTRHVAYSDPGSALRLDVLRDGKHQIVTLKAGIRPSEESLASARSGGKAEKPAPDAPVSTQVLGMGLSTLNATERERFSLDEKTKGVVVEKVERGSDAAKKGLRAGDVVVKAGTRNLSTPADMQAAVADAKREKRGNVLVMVNREGQNVFLPLSLGQAEDDAG